MRPITDHLEGIQDALIANGQPGDAANVIYDESKKLVRLITRITPPKKSGFAVPPADTTRQQIGKHAVRRDLIRAARPVTVETFKNKRLQKLILKGDFPGANALLKNMGNKLKNWRFERFTHDLHKSVRDRRGRVQRSKKVYITPVDFPLWNIRLATITRRVGNRLRGWYKIAKLLELPFPAFAKKGDFHGTGFIKLSGETPVISASSNASGVRDEARDIQDAVRIRGRKIKSRLRALLRGYARDINAKKKVERAKMDMAWEDLF